MIAMTKINFKVDYTFRNYALQGYDEKILKNNRTKQNKLWMHLKYKSTLKLMGY